MDPRGQVDPEFTQSSHALSRPCSLARTPEFPAQWPQTHFLMICVDLCSSFVLLMLTLPSRYNHRSEMVPRDSCVTAVRMGLGWTGGSVLYPRSLWHAMTDTRAGREGDGLWKGGKFTKWSHSRSMEKVYESENSKFEPRSPVVMKVCLST